MRHGNEKGIPSYFRKFIYSSNQCTKLLQYLLINHKFIKVMMASCWIVTVYHLTIHSVLHFLWGHHCPFWSAVPTPHCPGSVSRPEHVSNVLPILWVPFQCHVSSLKRALILVCCALSVQIKSRQLKPTPQASAWQLSLSARCWKTGSSREWEPVN